MRRREVTSTKSAKWMFGWVLRRLDKRQARMVIEGLRVADATKAKQVKSEDETETSFTGANVIFTSSVAFRDALVQLCLHAGFSAFFDVNTTKGARDFQMRATRTHWAVRYDGTDDRAIRPVVDTKDVRFDGREMAPKKALTAFKPASALVASLLDNVVHSGTATELGKKIGVSPATITTARRKNALLTKGGYRIETKADYDARYVSVRLVRPSCTGCYSCS